MKIYYTSSIRGVYSKEKSSYDQKIVEYLLHHGAVLGGSIINGEFNPFGDYNLSDKVIHDREINWVADSDAVMAEVSNPSLGVGYIIGRAFEQKKKILCIYKPLETKLSSMIQGNKSLKLLAYDTPEILKSILDSYLSEIGVNVDHASSISEVNRTAVHDLIIGKIH